MERLSLKRRASDGSRDGSRGSRERANRGYRYKGGYGGANFLSGLQSKARLRTRRGLRRDDDELGVY